MFNKDTLSEYLKPQKALLKDLRYRVVENAMGRALKCGDDIFSSMVYTREHFGSFFDEIWNEVFIPVLLRGAVLQEDYSVVRQNGKYLRVSYSDKKSEFVIILKSALPSELFEIDDVTSVVEVYGDITVKAKVGTATGFDDLVWQMYIDSFYATYSGLCQYLYVEMDSYFRELGAIVPDSELRGSIKAIAEASMKLISCTSIDKTELHAMKELNFWGL